MEPTGVSSGAAKAVGAAPFAQRNRDWYRSLEAARLFLGIKLAYFSHPLIAQLGLPAQVFVYLTYVAERDVGEVRAVVKLLGGRGAFRRVVAEVATWRLRLPANAFLGGGRFHTLVARWYDALPSDEMPGSLRMKQAYWDHELVESLSGDGKTFVFLAYILEADIGEVRRCFLGGTEPGRFRRISAEIRKWLEELPPGAFSL